MFSDGMDGIKERQMERKLKRLKPGDVIRFYRDGYTHRAIYIGMEAGAERRVIHWWTNGDTEEPHMRIDPFRTVEDILCFEGIEINHVERNMDSVVQRAKAFMNRVNNVNNVHGERNHYNGLFRNSSHFVDWCLSGLGGIDINLDQIMTVTDPWRFVYGFVTNTYISDYGTTYHNSMVLKNLERGDVIRCVYQHYAHWALYVGHLQGVHSVIHWWDKDGLDKPSIAIGNFYTVAGHCKAEIDWNNVDADGVRAADFATEFIQTVVKFPTIANLFQNPRQFAFWCLYGLGDLQNLPPMETEAEAQGFVEERKRISDPSDITGRHNNTVLATLMPGDVITFSQDSHKQFAVCVDRDKKGASLIWLTEIPGSVPLIMIDRFETIARNRKAMIYTDRENLNGVIDWRKMVDNARTLRDRVNIDGVDHTGLFSNSMHFALWVFHKYGPREGQKTAPEVGVNLWQHVYEYRSSSKIAANRQRNKRVLDSLQEGDLVKFDRNRYMHYAVFTGRYEDSGFFSSSIYFMFV